MQIPWDYMFQVVRKKSIHSGHFLNSIKAGVLERKMKKIYIFFWINRERASYLSVIAIMIFIHASGLDSFIDCTDIN